MNELRELKERPFRKSLFIGLLMTVIAFTVAMLISLSTRKTVCYLIVTSVIIGLFDYLIFFFLRKAKNVIKVITGFTLTIVNVIVLLWITIYFTAPTVLFNQNSSPKAYEALMANENIEKLSLKCSQGDITGWMLHNAQDGAPLIIFFHGNGENASKRMNRVITEQRIYMYKGYNIAIFSYPGYEGTKGVDNEEIVKEMGLCVYDGMCKRQDVNPDKIFLMGYSIGTGVANYVASQRDIKGLVLLAPYSNGYDMFNNVLPIFYGPFRGLVSFQMKAEDFAKSITVKPLILASQTDETIPYFSSENLSKQYVNGCDLNTFSGFGHNEFFDNEEVKSTITAYFKEKLQDE